MFRRKRKILKSLVLGLAVAAFAAPPALAGPDDRSFYRGTASQSVSPDDRSLYRGSSQQIVSPDDRSVFRGTSTQVDSQIVSSDDRSVFRGVETPYVPVSVTVSAASENFEWADAGLGAASTLAFVLLLGAATLMIRHQRRRLAAY